MQGRAPAGALERGLVRSTLPAHRPRIHQRTLLRAEGSNSAANGTFNKVLFTIPKRLEYGQSLCLTGESDGLGSWLPENSLQLKWNEGDVWGAEVALPAGEQYEYKYIIKQGHGTNATLKRWQPGGNCAVKVPAESGHKLQVIDDWRGKSRSVVYDDGEIGVPPTGTGNGPPAHTVKAKPLTAVELSAVTSSDSDHEDIAFDPSSSASQAAEQPANAGFFGQYKPSVQQSAGAAGSSASRNNSARFKSTSGGFFGQYKPASSGSESLIDDITGKEIGSLTVKDLKERLKSLGLPVSGRKAELIDRLAAQKNSE